MNHATVNFDGVKLSTWKDEKSNDVHLLINDQEYIVSPTVAIAFGLLLIEIAEESE